MASAASIDSQIAHFEQYPSLPIIDLRKSEAFRQGHWCGASHFHVDNIIQRMHELPKRENALRIYGTKEQVKVAQKILSEKGYRVKASIKWCESLENYLSSLNLLEKNDLSPRLWSPAPIIEKFQSQFVNNNEPGKALDIGCGSGRDSVYIASHGWQVCAIDYLPGALKKVEVLASNNRTTVCCHQLDLEKEQDKFKQFPGEFQLVLVIRYLHRPLLPLLKQKLAPGGYLVYQTFMQGCEAFGSPRNPKFLLHIGELAESFSDFDILLDEIEYLQDGRPTNVFIARKPD